MKTISALFLASLLAVLGYAIFWWVCLIYTTAQMKGAVNEAIQAEMTYGTPQWVPDPAQVKMDLPSAKLVMASGPIREIRAPSLRLISSFLMRDRWTMDLPVRVEIVLATGKILLLETEKGELLWQRDGSKLTLRADKVRLLDTAGNEIARLGDVMLERKSSDSGVRLNLASRPQLTNGEAVLSGQLVMPAQSFANVVNLFGNNSLPTAANMATGIVSGIGKGTLKIDNVSFRYPGKDAVSGGLSGSIQMLADGRVIGKLALSSDNPARTFGWLQKAGLLAPRSNMETIGIARFSSGLVAAKATVRMENMQSTLMLNGQPVGPLPNASSVIAKLWL